MLVNAIGVNSVPKAQVTFGRKLTKEEKPACTEDIKRGLDLLGKNMTIILPTNCSPSKTTKDVGIGQPYSLSSKEMLYPFLAEWGYTGWQQEPSGLRKPSDPSPYVSNSSAYNTLIIDLEKLTKPEQGKVLSKETYANTVNKNPKKGTNKTAFSYAVRANKEALKEAYETFDYKRNHLDELDEKERIGIENLNSDLELFIKENGEEQEINALYSVLSDIYDNDYWGNWTSETDKNLFDSPVPSKKSQERINQLKSEHKEEIESFMFSQMLAKKATDEGAKDIGKRGIKIKADIPVALSDAQVWGHKHLFLKDMRMGCSEPWSSEPQRWGFFVLDPNQVFNQDGSLGAAGKFLYDKYEKVFKENPGGVRIDHIVGLMDPYVYSESNPDYSGRLYSEIYRGKNGDPDKCDRILRKIVIPAAKAAGLDETAIITEDLGYMPNRTKEALYNLGVGGTCVTQWMKGHEIWHAPKNNAVMIANHDTQSVKELYDSKEERKEKFAELFASGARNVQVFWTDMLGIRERYNVPGVSGEQNWALRMSPDFEDSYHKQLQKDDGLNIPEAILEANKRRDRNFVHNHKELANALHYWSEVLKEKE